VLTSVSEKTNVKAMTFAPPALSLVHQPAIVVRGQGSGPIGNAFFVDLAMTVSSPGSARRVTHAQIQCFEFQRDEKN